MPIDRLFRGKNQLQYAARFVTGWSVFILANAREPRHFLAMQSYELLREVFQKHSAKHFAAELGLSLSMIYKWAEPPDPTAGSGAVNPLDRIDALQKCSGDPRIVQWICQRAGGFFIKNPRTTHPHPEFLIPATNEIIQEFADLLAVIAKAVADNQITVDEAADIRGRWEELKCVTEGFVRCCEEGNFRTLKKHVDSTKKTRTQEADSKSPSPES
jgi:hypothetical protein